MSTHAQISLVRARAIMDTLDWLEKSESTASPVDVVMQQFGLKKRTTAAQAIHLARKITKAQDRAVMAEVDHKDLDDPLHRMV